MDRGVSTVLDVGLACLLVTASATLLVTTPVTSADPPDADRIGRALLPSTIAIEADGNTVETSIGDVLVEAARDGAIAPDARTVIVDRIRDVHRRTRIAASIEGGPTVTIGSEPEPGVSVDAMVFRIGLRDLHDPGNPATDSTVVIVVRAWSP